MAVVLLVLVLLRAKHWSGQDEKGQLSGAILYQDRVNDAISKPKGVHSLQVVRNLQSISNSGTFLKAAFATDCSRSAPR